MLKDLLRPSPQSNSQDKSSRIAIEGFGGWDLPWVGMVVLELDLVACDRLTKGIEDDEARRCGALVNAADEPASVGLIASLANTTRQLVDVHLV
jgi:hypothetical protein